MTRWPLGKVSERSKIKCPVGGCVRKLHLTSFVGLPQITTLLKERPLPLTDNGRSNLKLQVELIALLLSQKQSQPFLVILVTQYIHSVLKGQDSEAI